MEERTSSRHGILRRAASPCASDSSVSSPRRETLAEAAGAGEEEAVETTPSRSGGGSGHLSAKEKGSKQEADADLPGAGAGAGVDRPALGPRRVLFPSATTEIEEAPPSPPPSPRILAKNAARGLAVNAAGPAGLERRPSEQQREEEAALGPLAGRLRQLSREGGDGCLESEPGAEEDAGGCIPEAFAARLQMTERTLARVQMMQQTVRTLCEALNERREMMAAARVHGEEMQAEDESSEYMGMDLGRKNSKSGGTCNWKRIVSVIAFASGLALLIQFRTLLPVAYLTHIVGAIAVLWILGSIPFCLSLFGTSRTMEGFSRHVPWLAYGAYVCFSLLVLYALYLNSRHVYGTSDGLLLGKRQ